MEDGDSGGVVNGLVINWPASKGTDIAIDPTNGDIHVTYSTFSVLGYETLFPGQLHYALHRDGAWRHEVVDRLGGEDSGASSSLTLDSHGYPHISYMVEVPNWETWGTPLYKRNEWKYATPLVSALGSVGE